MIGCIGSNTTFVEEVTDIVWEKDVSFIDAIVIWCEKHNVEPESVGALVKKDSVLLALIESEAQDLRILPRGNKLPL